VFKKHINVIIKFNALTALVSSHYVVKVMGAESLIFMLWITIHWFSNLKQQQQHFMLSAQLCHLNQSTGRVLFW